MGHAPQSFAKAASERIRSGLSPKTIKNSAALLAPTPNPARRVGDVPVVSRARCHVSPVPTSWGETSPSLRLTLVVMNHYS